MMHPEAKKYSTLLQLHPHPEGGAYRETYRSALTLKADALPPGFNGDRQVSTMIYFLLSHGEFSAFHRIRSDEAWHFYAGSTLTIYEITVSGELHTHRLGSDLANGESFQHLIAAGSWFASRCEVPGSFTLVGCTVSPGFDFRDFEMASRDMLLHEFPQHASLISELAHP
jgi:predicted cupin superfamily sugar epimerase